MFSGTKQTIHRITQIQPLENGVEYTVTVQSVQGTYTYKPSTFDPADKDPYATANGNLSPSVTLSVIPSSARVDAMRKRLTAFFDDFKSSAGAFDELKWNHSSTACSGIGEDGQFINAQFHAHNETRSVDCDRDATVSRPRAVFDITGRTESNPGQIEFDIDGVSQPRDSWYIDLIPTNAHKNGIPLDVTAHSAEDSTDDPGKMIRFTQHWQQIGFFYFDENINFKEMQMIPVTSTDWLFSTDQKVARFSPIPETNTQLIEYPYPFGGQHAFVPNVRRHWVLQVSHEKIKLFVDSALILEAITPALFSDVNTFVIHSTLFSYNTGKDSNVINPTTAMLHWDNFGFNGPAPTTVTHNYLDGGPDGTYPLVARGTLSHPVPGGSRDTKIPIPDPIGTIAGKARLMFTIQNFGPQTYQWNFSNHVIINGKRYAFPDPYQNIWYHVATIADSYRAHSTGIYVDPADLKQGLNDVYLDFGPYDVDFLNVHLELDYDKSNAPSYTQPKDVFKNVDFTSIVAPQMRPNDMYWFIEQDMGLAKYFSPTPTVNNVVSPTATSVAVKLGDANGDGKVDGQDYIIWLTHYNQTTNNKSTEGDFDGNGRVDGVDYITWLNTYGK